MSEHVSTGVNRREQSGRRLLRKHVGAVDDAAAHKTSATGPQDRPLVRRSDSSSQASSLVSSMVSVPEHSVTQLT